MGIGYAAMLTAFYVDNGPHLPLWDRLPILSFWLLPVVLAPARRRRRPPDHPRQEYAAPSPAHNAARTRPSADKNLTGATGFSCRR
jgi:hypothetical protein